MWAITVQVSGDRLGEPNETFFVNLSNANYGVISDGQGVGTILDDEPRISISDVNKAQGKKRQTTLCGRSQRAEGAGPKSRPQSGGRRRTSERLPFLMSGGRRDRPLPAPYTGRATTCGPRTGCNLKGRDDDDKTKSS
jgi:hypothetical protein